MTKNRTSTNIWNNKRKLTKQINNNRQLTTTHGQITENQQTQFKK